MKIDLYKSEDRGSTHLDWLDSKHLFSFNQYYDPNRMGFGVLRVLNDDRVTPGGGFGTHQHQDMEIISIVLDGALEHQDSTGIREIIPAGDIQRMSAGSGIYHSEYNYSDTESVHFLQIWIQTKEKGIQPSYEQKRFSMDNRKNKLVKIVSGEKDKDTIYIHQNADFYLGELDNEMEIVHSIINPKEKAQFIYLTEGEIQIGDIILKSEDGIAITEAKEINIKANKESRVLLIEIPNPEQG